MKYSTQVKPISYLKNHAAEVVKDLFRRAASPCASRKTVKPGSW